MNTITYNNIKELEAKQLTELLLKLLHLEHKKFSFPDCYISVPQNINAADGGEDGRIETSDFKTSRWVINKTCLFQCKASDMPKGKCKEEILTKSKELKPQVKEVLDKNGTYILVTTQAIVENRVNELSERVMAIREGIKEAKIKEGVPEKDAESFSKNAKVKIYDANKLSDWTNEFISTVIYVQKCIGITRPLGLLTWEELKSYKENTEVFKSNIDLDNIINSLRNDLFNGKNIRIEGISGIGKTRLVCEVLDPGDRNNGEYDLKQKTLSDSTLYFDLNQGSSRLLNFIKSHSQDIRALLVLDNCSPSDYNLFVKEVNRWGSNLQIITIDYDKVNNTYNTESEKILELKGKYYASITKSILKEKYNGVLLDNEIDFLVNFSEGNTKMAIDFAKASISKVNLNENFDDELVRKLVFGREDVNEVEFKILKIISVFKTVEFPSDEYHQINENHYDQLLEATKFFSNFFGITEDKIYTTINKFLQKGTIERRGNLIMVRPGPLALKLSILFWNELTPPKYKKFIQEIPKSHLDPLSQQLGRIGNVNKAKELVNTIWGVNGNFSTAEILNSNMGSQLFRSIVTVNPEATTKVLVKHFLDKPKEYLETIVEGRQNLVWALEKLCFRNETFLDATKVLMCFAVAEIETYYSNNSSSYFKQLFRIYLAGTEVSYGKRVEVLNWGINKNNNDFDRLCLGACESALSQRGTNSRIIGAENQGGSTPLKDYQPKSYGEVQEYLDEVINIIRHFIHKTNDLAVLAQKLLYTNLFTLDQYQYDFNKIKDLMIDIAENPMYKKEFSKTIGRIRSFNGISKKGKEFIDEFLKLSVPTTIEEKITRYVSEPEPIYNEDRKGNRTDEAKLVAEKFSKEIIDKNVDLAPYFDKLFLGYQFQTFNFGKKYGEGIGYDKAFVSDLVNYLLTIENKAWSASFLNGYVVSIKENERQQIFDIFFKNKSIFSFSVFRHIIPSYKNASKLLELIKNGHNINRLDYSKYELIKLPIDDLTKFLSDLESMNSDLSILINVLHHYIWNQKRENLSFPQQIIDYCKKLVLNHNLLECSINIDLYAWEDLMNFSLDHYGEDIVNKVSKDIMTFSKNTFPNYTNDYHIANIAIKTLELNFEKSWGIFSKLLFKREDYIIFGEIFDIGFIMGAKNTHRFFQNTERNNKIFEWCKKHPKVANWFIRISPLYSEGNSWFEFTKKMIDEFGNNVDFISELSSNLYSMSTVGSRVPYLKSRQNLVKELVGHKFDNLNKWAIQEVENYEKEIKREQIIDEEENLRY
ncbi:hypothetical protein [Aquimarina celericrescens]|uniref:Restriction endonuclease type IV Mrr domain-containing protein n=1 Tax=Aquimarina celericrescens TaxID=1964542 RepID=A0ABW5AUK7_9FLAO|nr:hypothetical protein [Aquimarina celericrescens]